MMTMTTGEGKDDASSGDGADAEVGPIGDGSSADAAGMLSLVVILIHYQPRPIMPR